jgi:uncharacterized membrane protein YraQ (UPF0718 family)
VQPSILDFLINFSSVLWEALPFIVLGALVAGVLEELLPQQLLTRVLPKAFVPSVLIGGALGLVFPMCECGIVVVMRRLLRKGLPLSCCIAYMLAGPIVNGVVIFSTWVAFKDHKIGPEMVGLRIGFGFCVAIITGFVVHYLHKKHGNDLLKPVAVPPVEPPAPEAAYEGANGSAPTNDPSAPPKRTIGQRLGNISGTALHDFVDITVFLILGAALAALVRSYISTAEIEAFSREQPYLAIPAMMLLGFLMCLCSEADAFVAASFTNMHITAKLAFLVLGPMLDIKLILMYTRVFRLRLILTIVACVVVLVLALCLGLYQVYQLNGWSGVPPGAQ